jgi:hypothetical protein
MPRLEHGVLTELGRWRTPPVEEAQFLQVLDCVTGCWSLVRVLDRKAADAEPDGPAAA